MGKERPAHILDPESICWFDPEESRLDYKMIFEEHNGASSGSHLREEEVERLKQREKEWQERLEAARTEAYQLGLREGREQGKARERERLQPAIEELREGALEAGKASRERWRVLEQQLVGLAFQLAEKVMDVELDEPDLRSRLETSLTGMMDQLQDRTEPRLVVHPDDLEPIRDLVEATGLMDQLQLKTDESYRRGEYRIETRKEVLVATYRELLDELKRDLLSSGHTEIEST